MNTTKRINEANIDSCTSPAVLTTLRRIHELGGSSRLKAKATSTITNGSNAERLLLGALACTTIASSISKENFEAPPCFLTVVGDYNPVISIVHHLSLYGSSGFCAKRPNEGRILGFVNALDGASSTSSGLPPIVKAPALDTSLSLFGSIKKVSSTSILETIVDLWSHGAEEREDDAYIKHNNDTMPISDFDFLSELYETRDHSALIRHCDLISILEKRKRRNSNNQEGRGSDAKQLATHARQPNIKQEDSSDEEQKRCASYIASQMKQSRKQHSNKEEVTFHDLRKLMWCPREWASYLLEHSENGSTLSPYRAFHLIHNNILGMNCSNNSSRRLQLREYADSILQWLALACLSKPSNSSEMSSMMEQSSSFVSVKWEPIISCPPKLITWANSVLGEEKSNLISTKDEGTTQFVASDISNVDEAESFPCSYETGSASSKHNISNPATTSFFLCDGKNKTQTHISCHEQQHGKRKNKDESGLSKELLPTNLRHISSTLHPKDIIRSLPSVDCTLVCQRSAKSTNGDHDEEGFDDSSLTVESNSLSHNQSFTTAKESRRDTASPVNMPQNDKLSSSVARAGPIILCVGMILISQDTLYRKREIEEERRMVEDKFKCKLYVGKHKMEDGGGYKFVLTHESVKVCQSVLQSIQSRLVYRSVFSEEHKKGGLSFSPSGVYVALLTRVPRPSIRDIKRLFWSKGCSLRRNIEDKNCCKIRFAGTGDGTEREFADIKYVEHYSKFPPHYFAHNHRSMYNAKYDLFVDTMADTERNAISNSSANQNGTCLFVTGASAIQVFKAAFSVLSKLEKACIHDNNQNPHLEQQPQQQSMRQLQQKPDRSHKLIAERRRRNSSISADKWIEDDWPNETGGTGTKKRRISPVDRV